MARLITGGFETRIQSTVVQEHGDSNNTNQAFFQQVGTPTIDTTNPRSGVACMSCAAASSYARVSGGGIYGTLDRTYYTRFAMRLPDATPSSQFNVAAIQINTVNTAILQLTTGGVLNLLDANLATVGSSSALSDNTWYVIEIELMIPTASTGTLGFRIDGTQIARSTTVDVNNSVATPRIHVGVTGATAGVTVLIDDIAINDDQGSDQNGFPGNGKIILLPAISDNTVGANWEAPQTTGSDTTNIYTAVANRPPVGVLHSDVDANNAAYVFHASATVPSNYDVNCQTYTSGGVGASDTIVVTQALVRATTASLSGTNAMGLRSVSNPADGADTTGVNLEPVAVGGTEPAGWKSYRTAPLYPSVTKGTSPVVRAIKTEAAARAHQVDLMGLLVEYLVVSAAPQDVPLGTCAAISDATLPKLTAPTAVPLGSSPAVADATLALRAPTAVPLETAAAQSDATLAIEPFVDDYSTVVLGDSPTGYWRLGEPSGTTAVDSAGPYDGTYEATPTLAQTGAIATSSDTAVSFAAASNEAVSVTDNAALRPGTSSYSVEFWVKRNGNPSGSEFLIAKPGGGAAGSWHLQVLSTGILRLSHVGTVVLESVATVTDNAWHHVVFAMTRSATSYVYIDGQQDNSATADAYNLTASSVLVFAARFTTGTYNNGLTGSLDEVALYIGTALSSGQVAEHYEIAEGVQAATVPLDPAAAQSAATVALKAATQVPLGTAAAQSAATITLAAATQVPLGTSPAQSAATLALRAPTGAPLAQADALSAATLALKVPTQVVLGSADALSAATAAVYYPGATIPLGTCAAVSDASGFFHLDAYDPYADATKSNGASFYWRFEETDVARDHGVLGDVGTRTFDGTYVNSPTLGVGALARAATEKGITFASASSQRVTATASGFGSSLDTATIEFFVKTTTSGRGVLLGAANTAGAPTSLLIRANTDAAGNALAGATRFYLSDNANAEVRCHITTAIYDGNWHHVIGVVGASGWEIYVDGAGVTESSASGTPGTYNDFNVSLDLGALNFQGSHVQYFDGSLDEVAFYPTRFDAFGAVIHRALSLYLLVLQSSPAQSDATLALRAPTAVSLGTSPAQSAATLTLRATTQVPLGTAAAQSAATATVEVAAGAQQVPLGTAAAQSAGTLALSAATRVPLGSSPAQSAATLALAGPTRVTLGSAAAQSASTLTLKAATRVPLGSAVALSAASVALSAATAVPLGSAAAQSSATLSLGLEVTGVTLELAALWPDPELYPNEELYPYIGARAQSAATLTLGIYPGVPLGSSAAQSSASLALKVPTRVTLGTCAAQSAAQISLVTRRFVLLGTAAAQSAGTLTVSYRIVVLLGSSPAQSAATLAIGLFVPPPDTHPELGARDYEVATSGIYDQALTGGVILEGVRSAVAVNLRGASAPQISLDGIHDETTTGGDVVEPDLDGIFDDALTGAEVF